MGALCSTEEKGATVLDEAEAESKTQRPSPAYITKMPPASFSTRVTRGKMKGESALLSVEAFNEARNAMLAREQAQAFDGDAQKNATALEKRAVQIVKDLKKHDAVAVYANLKDENGKQRVPADHFLGNVGIINKTELFNVAQQMPKGAHLHCHFNSCLPPEFLIGQARDVEAMWIKSTTSLFTAQGMKDAEIAFQVQEPPHVQNARVPAPAVLIREGDLFDTKYESGAWMRYSEFLTACGGYEIAENWLVSKMLLNEDEVHHIGQSGKKYVT
jgi:adenosine deaminase CECR1